MSLFNQITIWNEKTSFLLRYHGNFWGKYASIADFDNVSLQAAKEYQQQKINNYFKAMAFHPKFEAAYKFIMESNKMLETVSEDNILNNQTLNKIYSAIIDVYNSYFKDSKIYNSNFSEISDTQLEKIKEIDKLLDSFSLNYLFVEESFLKHFENLVASSINLKDYVNKKADAVETLAKRAFDEYFKKESGLFPLVTGQLENHPKGQLIQDTMVIDIDIFNQTTQNKRLNYLFKDLLKEINETPIDKHLILDNELYDALSKASKISTQVKSGKNQAIWNTEDSMYSNIAIKDLSGPYDTAFNQLQELCILENPQWIEKEKGNKQSIDAAMNYELANKAIDFLHANENENQLLFTDKGFISFYQYLVEHDTTWQFQLSVGELDANFLSKKRKVTLRRSLLK